jgi:predicted nuclease with TOPRIM domain
MSNVRELLQSRRADLHTKLAPLFAKCTELRKSLILTEAEIAKLNAEIKDIDFAVKALDEAQQKKSGNLTIMQAALEVLKDKLEGMTALEILAEINLRFFGGTVRRHSLSPQLSRLKDRDRKIELRGDRWFILPDEPGLFPPKS